MSCTYLRTKYTYVKYKISLQSTVLSYIVAGLTQISHQTFCFALFIAYYCSRQLENVFTKNNQVEPMLCWRYMSSSRFMRFIVVAIMYHIPVEFTTKTIGLSKFSASDDDYNNITICYNWLHYHYLTQNVVLILNTLFCVLYYSEIH